MLTTGLTASLNFSVTEDDTSIAVGSGSVPVLGTPRVIAWLEAATCAALAEHLDQGQTSVGTRVDVQHLAPTPVGTTVEVTASTVHVDKRLVRFTCSARNLNADGSAGKVVAAGEITRVVVDFEKFVSRL